MLRRKPVQGPPPEEVACEGYLKGCGAPAYAFLDQGGRLHPLCREHLAYWPGERTAGLSRGWARWAVQQVLLS